MNEERRQILQMLAENRITADEAERLLDAVGRELPEPGPGGAKARPKYLRVIMNSEEGDEGPSKINIRVPLRLLRAGVRLASLMPPVAITRANEELARAGVPIDLAELKPQQLEELVDALDELTFDLDDPRNTMRVFCE
ncbi:hypothetical protein LO763_27435 [Glycomyces sp. A-F 0318]|uniref:SHOCT-like domain-containing protein n=1 Tax=Glycomyces amatae TaxID=2881355 RepID=UPI001E4DFF2D|nr:hypothetical protein [Glycomyces amatae]MCD0447355.1 hypothetical protein [Glycomyces amatae]